MTFAELIDLIHKDPTTGLFCVLFLLLFFGGFAGLIVGLLWAMLKSGKQVAVACGSLLLIQGIAFHYKFLDRGGQHLALGMILGGLALIIGASIFMQKPEPTPEEREKEINRETRSALHSVSGKIIVLLGAVVCFAVIWVIQNEPQDENSAMLKLVFFLLGCAGVLTFLFPSKAASLLEVLNSLNPRRHNW